MADTMEPRVTRSRSNELRRLQAMGHRSFINGTMTSARDHCLDGYPMQGEQQMHVSNGAGGEEHEQAALVPSDSGAYGRNTSEEMVECMNSVASDAAPEAAPAPLEHAHESVTHEDSEELFRNWMQAHMNEQAMQTSTDGHDVQLQPGDPIQSVALEVPTSQAEGSPWHSVVDDVQHGILPDSATLSEESPPSANNNYTARNSRKRGRAVGESRFSPKALVSGYPSTRRRSSEIEKDQSLQPEGAISSSGDALKEGGVDASLESRLNPAGVAATPITLSALGSEGNQSSNTDPNLLISKPPMDSPVSHAAQGNPLQQSSTELHPDRVLDELNLLRSSILKAKQKGGKNTSNGRKPQAQTSSQQLISRQQKQQQGKSKVSPVVNNEHDQNHNAQDLMAQLQSPHMQDNSGLAHSPTTSQPSSDGPATSGVIQSQNRVETVVNTALDEQPVENGSASADVPQRPELLSRAGSMPSSHNPGYQINQLDGATKERRKERVAKIKNRNQPSGSMPEDVDAAMKKRCEALEEKVRSLKLNLSFMNRTDSEQKKRIEDLQQENDDLKAQKKKLTEQLELGSVTPQREVAGGRRTLRSWK